MKKRVVITGMGVASSIGSGLELFWKNACSGKLGVQRIQRYDPSPYPTQIGGEILDVSLDGLPFTEKYSRYPEAIQYALYCAHYAIFSSGLSEEERKWAGTFIGTSLGGAPEAEIPGYEAVLQGNWKKIPALSVLKTMPNSVANLIAIAFGLGGANTTISNACISSAEAIGQAYRQIAHGYLKVAVCGGSESLLWEPAMAAWCKLRVMSTRNETPETACRPFSKDRDGLVMSDGAGMLVLEEREQALARGATIWGEIVGYGASSDASHLTAPSSEGQVRAILNALDDAKLSINDIQYINAHGTGTLLNDRVETETIKKVFGERAYEIPITAQKAMTGHAIGAAGAMEIIATTLSLKHGILLPTCNFMEKDPECDLDYIPNEARHRQVDIALSNHFAFGGANVALICQRAD